MKLFESIGRLALGEARPEQMLLTRIALKCREFPMVLGSVVVETRFEPEWRHPDVAELLERTALQVVRRIHPDALSVSLVDVPDVSAELARVSLRTTRTLEEINLDSQKVDRPWADWMLHQPATHRHIFFGGVRPRLPLSQEAELPDADDDLIRQDLSTQGTSWPEDQQAKYRGQLWQVWPLTVDRGHP